jgi:uncharacterized protein (DUF952 family)
MLDRLPRLVQISLMLVYKILRSTEWTELETSGATLGAPVDRADGFVHFSTAEQLSETLRRHFGEEKALFLLAIDSTLLETDLRWERSRGGALFPHLFRPLELSDVLWCRPLEDGADGPICPEGLE